MNKRSMRILGFYQVQNQLVRLVRHDFPRRLPAICVPNPMQIQSKPVLSIRKKPGIVCSGKPQCLLAGLPISVRRWKRLNGMSPSTDRIASISGRTPSGMVKSRHIFQKKKAITPACPVRPRLSVIFPLSFTKLPRYSIRIIRSAILNLLKSHFAPERGFLNWNGRRNDTFTMCCRIKNTRNISRMPW